MKQMKRQCTGVLANMIDKLKELNFCQCKYFLIILKKNDPSVYEVHTTPSIL